MGELAQGRPSIGSGCHCDLCASPKPGVVGALYQQYLHRAADTRRLVLSQAELQAGARQKRPLSAWWGLRNADKVAGDPNRLYVQQLYLDLLGDKADVAG